jgi:hypothetical protein
LANFVRVHSVCSLWTVLRANTVVRLASPTFRRVEPELSISPNIHTDCTAGTIIGDATTGPGGATRALLNTSCDQCILNCNPFPSTRQGNSRYRFLTKCHVVDVIVILCTVATTFQKDQKLGRGEAPARRPETPMWNGMTVYARRLPDCRLTQATSRTTFGTRVFRKRVDGTCFARGGNSFATSV